MVRFIKQILVSTIMFFSSLSNVNSLECVSMKNQKCKARLEIVNISSYDPIFYPFSIKVNKCSSNCNNISDPYAKTCVSDVVKNLNIKVFRLITLSNETRHIEWHETYMCICRLDKTICNSKQRWNEDKCRCQCKELVDKGICNKEYLFNPNNCNCECNKSCGISEYLDYSNCMCRKTLIDPLVKECTENIDVIKNDNGNELKKECSSCIVYIGLFSIFFTISIGNGIYFVYSHWYLKRYSLNVDINTHKGTLIY